MLKLSSPAVLGRLLRRPHLGPTQPRGQASLFTLACALILGLALAGLVQTASAASPGLPLTEDFTDTGLRDATQTTANWSPEEEAVLLAWRQARFGVFAEVTGSDISSDTDNIRAIAVADMDGDGDLDVVVGNNGVTNKLYLNDGDGDPFTSVTATNISSDADYTYALAVADMDGDGDLDVVVGNNGVTNKLYLNDGDGDPFTSVTATNIGSDTENTFAIAVGDMNGDGLLDVVVGNNDVTNKLYLNDGDDDPFTSVTGTNIGSETDDTEAIAVADMDGDGDLDVVAGNNGTANKLYLNDGDGDPFTSATGISIGSETDITRAIAVGDMNGDGLLDVVAGNIGQNKLYLNDGDGDPFTSVTATNIGSDTDNTRAIAVADMDGDGDLDVVAGNNAATNKLYLNDGDGDPFTSVTATNIGSDTDNTFAIAVADINGDGLLDVVVGNKDQTNKLYLSNSTSDPFTSVTGTEISSDTDSTRAIAVADMNGDGLLDVVAGNNAATNKLYLNDGDGDPFTSVTGTNIGSDTDTTNAIAVADMNGDGLLDVVAGNYGETNKLYLNDGDGDPFTSVTATNISSDTDNTYAIALGDIDGDGDLDVVAGNINQTNKLYLNDGDDDPFTSVTATNISSDTDYTTVIALGDMDGDGLLDVVAGNGGETNKLYLNDGDDDPFTSVTGIDIGSETDITYDLAVADMNGDGDLDVVAGNSGETNKLYLNDGDDDPFTSVTATNISSDTDITTAIAVADMDGDGDLDVVAGNSASKTNKLYLNDGDDDPFTSVTATNISSDTDITRAIAVADMDGDGDLDVVAGNNGTANKLYLSGRGAVPFVGITGSDISSDSDNTLAIAVGDMNGDGLLDVVMGNDGTNKLYLNNGTGAPFAAVSGSAIGSDSDSTQVIAVGDMNGDGALDVVAGNFGATNKLYLNDGDDDPFTSVTTGTNISSDTDTTQAIAVADMDGDGALDVVAGNFYATNKLYLNDGDAAPFDTVTTGSAIGSDSNNDNTYALAVADMNGDGALDVVVGNYGATNELYLNDGDDDPFTSVTAIDIGSDTDSTFDIAVADMDGDGDLDVVAGNEGQNKLYLNDGTGDPFTSVTAIDIGSDTDSTNAIAVGDMNGDGHLDVVVGNFGATNKLYLNDGDAAPFDTVTTGSAIGSDSNNDIANAIAVGDMNGDGDLDVVVGTNNSATNKLYRRTLYDTSRGRATSLTVDATSDDITTVQVESTATVPLHTSIDYWVSNNGGSKWFLVTPDQPFTFPTTGSDLRWRAELSSLSPISSPRLDTLVITAPTPPTAVVALPTQTVDVNSLVILDGSSSSDSDGDVPLTYGWQQVGGPSVSITPNSYVALTTFTAPATATVLTFTLTVTDTTNMVSAPVTTTITVNDTPIEGLAVVNDSPVTFGDIPVNFTATVSSGSNVNYIWDFGDGTVQAAGALPAGSTINHFYTTAGTYTALVTATNSVGSVTASTPVTVDKAATTTALELAPQTLPYGEHLVMTATVSSDVSFASAGEIDIAGSPSLVTGDVQLYVNGQPDETYTLDANGQVVIDEMATIPPATYTLSVVYPGNSNLLPSTSNVASLTVNKLGSSITLASSPNPARVGESVVFTATVEGDLGLDALNEGIETTTIGPSSTITFMDGSDTLGTATLDANGTATFSTNTLSVGSHNITALYGGDAIFTPSASNVLAQVVTGDAPLAVNDAAGTLEGQAVTIAVLANDVAGNDPNLSLHRITQPANGSIGSQDGTSVIYTPNPGFNGLDSFSYTVVDGNGLTGSGTVAVVVSAQAASGKAPQVAILNNNANNDITFSDAKAVLEITVPSGAYTGTVDATDVFYLALTWLVEPGDGDTGNLQFANLVFDLSAYLNGTQLESFVFGAPVTMSISYADTLLGELPPESLQLRFLAGETWSNEGITLIQHDATNRIFVVEISHLSEFALFATSFLPGSTFYLPRIGR